MQKRDMIWIIFLLLTGMLAGWYLICGLSKNKGITVVGSVAMETFAEALAEQAEERNVKVQPEFIGSTAGIEALLKGKAEMALVSRYLTEEEKQQGIMEYVVAYDGIVIIVNRENTITNLSKEELSDIFTERITNWKELGGADEPIVVIGREYGSGTRDSFEELLAIKEKSRYSNECDSIGVVKAKVGLLKGAIGYVSLEAVENSGKGPYGGVKKVAIEQAIPDKNALEQGNYFLARPFILATLGKRESQCEEIRKIFRLLETKQGEIIFEKAGVAAAAKTK